MHTNYEKTDWLETAKNFQSDLSQIVKDESLLKILNKIMNEINAKLPLIQGISELERIKFIFTHVYNRTIMSQSEYMNNQMMFIIHPEFTDITDPIFDACFFTALCMFIHDTKQTKSISLRKFIYQYSSSQYNEPGSNLWVIWETIGKNAFWI